MSKYGEFEVVRTERLKCKRSNDPNADEEGMREYSYLKCPHCKKEVIEIASNNMEKQKHSAIKDHIMVCPSFTGERPIKKTRTIAAASVTTSTVMVVAPAPRDELVELKAEMAAFKQKVANEKEEMEQKMANEKEKMERKMSDQQEEIKGLQDKSCLYDSVLEAVMPSLVLPLTAPEEYAKITLREAAIKDIAPRTLALPSPEDVVSREMHIAMMEQKDALIAVEKERREELKEAHMEALEKCKRELEAKDLELSKTKQEKEEAERRMEEADRRRREADLRVQEASKTWTSLSSRTDRLQKERDALDAKYRAALKGHEQAVRNHGKHGQSPLSKMQQVPKRGYATDAEAAAAKEIEREFAQKRARG